MVTSTNVLPYVILNPDGGFDVALESPPVQAIPSAAANSSSTDLDDSISYSGSPTARAASLTLSHTARAPAPSTPGAQSPRRASVCAGPGAAPGLDVDEPSSAASLPGLDPGSEYQTALPSSSVVHTPPENSAQDLVADSSSAPAAAPTEHPTAYHVVDLGGLAPELTVESRAHLREVLASTRAETSSLPAASHKGLRLLVWQVSATAAMAVVTVFGTKYLAEAANAAHPMAAVPSCFGQLAQNTYCLGNFECSYDNYGVSAWDWAKMQCVPTPNGPLPPQLSTTVSPVAWACVNSGWLPGSPTNVCTGDAYSTFLAQSRQQFNLRTAAGLLGAFGGVATMALTYVTGKTILQR